MSKPVFGYWNLRGLAHPAKLALIYLQVDFEDKRYPMSEEGYAEWNKSDKFNLGLDFPNLPYWKDSGRNLTESRAVLKCIAREFGGGVLMPTKHEQISTTEMVESVLWDVWWYLLRRCFYDNDEHKATMTKNAPAKLELLNKFLGHNKKWILGDQISYVDFMLYEILYHYTTYDPEYLKPYPRLHKLKENFENLPEIQKYINSPQYIKGPCINPFAKHKI